MNKKQNRRRLIIIAIIALLALLLGVGIYCITQPKTTEIDNAETPLAGLVWDANAEEGGLVQRSEEEIRAELNEKVAQGMINISMNTSPVFENGTTEEMFFGCSNLTTLDLSTWDTASATDMTAFFSGCPALTTIWASDSFVVPTTAIATDMFLNTYALVGGNGTQCTSANQSYTYARIDRPGSPGFFTEK